MNLSKKSISKAMQHRENILKGKVENWLYTKWKVQEDALIDEDSKIIYDYWTNTADRPTGDKKDFVKKRIGKNEYFHHAKQVLEKTQTESFIEFTSLHPEIKVKQRKLESFKPFLSSRPKKGIESRVYAENM